ncbi:hypothetical protein ACOMHN_050558 [Nucella lapillus]
MVYHSAVIGGFSVGYTILGEAIQCSLVSVGYSVVESGSSVCCSVIVVTAVFQLGEHECLPHTLAGRQSPHSGTVSSQPSSTEAGDDEGRYNQRPQRQVMIRAVTTNGHRGRC